MASRLSLHEELKKIPGIKKVYFNPPARMEYPCIRYKLDGVVTRKANNKMYNKTNKYMVTAIMDDVDTTIVEDMYGAFPMISLNRTFTADNLSHYVFTLYY